MASHIEDAELARRRAIFSQLDALNGQDDDAPDQDYAASMSALARYAERYQSVAKTHHSTDHSTAARSDVLGPSSSRKRPTNVVNKTSVVNEVNEEVAESTTIERVALLRRSESTPARPHVAIDGTEVLLIQDTPVSLQQSITHKQKDFCRATKATTTLQRSSTVPNMFSTTGKRKRGVQALQIPLEQQMFTNLLFMFVPNDEANPARRIRIQKAVQHGATRATAWSNSVTHVIVDSNLVAADILKALKVESLPTTARIVDESFISTCLAHKCLVDASQSRYQVKGVQELLYAAPSEKPVSEPSDRSLQLKPAKGAGVTYEPRTPSKVDEESVRVLDPETEDSPVPAQARTVADEPTGIRNEHNDALQDAIDEAKAAPALARIETEDDMSRPTSSDHNTDSDHDHTGSPDTASSRQKKAGYTKRGDWQQKFQCMHPGADKEGDNPNETTIAMLQELEVYYYQTREQWRTRAYRQGIAALRKQTRRITTKEEAQSIPGIGESIAAKIEEIVWTNRLQRLENTKLEPTDHALKAFIKIYGVGYQQASKWVQEGHRTLDDLLQKVKLTTNQKIGIEHYEDFQLRTPRPETDQLGAIVRSCLQKIDPDIQAMIGGSYRRGAPDSGDIDFIITKLNAGADYLRQVVTDNAIPYLTKIGFLTAGLAVTSQKDGSKWHGACQLPLNPNKLSISNPNDPKTNSNPWRRIDFLLVPWDELGAALIYFTGNDIFNRSMRLLARKKGMRLNQTGLYKDVMRKGAEKLNEGTKISGSEEREIFEILGVPYRGPTERNC